jgi:hypothetical protein
VLIYIGEPRKSGKCYTNRPGIWFVQFTVISSHEHPLSSHYATLINYNNALPKLAVNMLFSTVGTHINVDNVKKCISVSVQGQVVNHGDQYNKWNKQIDETFLLIYIYKNKKLIILLEVSSSFSEMSVSISPLK